MSRQTPTDRELEVVLTAYGDRLMALAWSLTGHRQDAEDLLQDTMALVIHRWGKVQESASTGAYLRAMMVNRFLSRKRRAASREVVSDEAVHDHQEPVTDDLDAGIDRAELVTLVARLPRRQRAVVVLRYLEEMSVTETADALGMTPGAVRSNAHRAMGTLRRAMTQEPDEGGVPRAIPVT